MFCSAVTYLCLSVKAWLARPYYNYGMLGLPAMAAAKEACWTQGRFSWLMEAWSMGQGGMFVFVCFLTPMVVVMLSECMPCMLMNGFDAFAGMGLWPTVK